MLRCAKISLFKFLLPSDFKWLVLVQNFLLLDLYPAKLLLPVTSPLVLHKTYCHWNVFDIYRANVVGNMLVPLLVRCNFDLFKCWCFMFLLRSIKLMFVFVHIYSWWLFTIWALCWSLSFVVMMLEIETSQVGDFADTARSIIDFAVSHASLSDGMSLVPTWKVMWPGLFRIIGWSTTHLTFAPWDGFTYTMQFPVLAPITYPFKCLIMLSPTINTRLLSFLSPTD